MATVTTRTPEDIARDRLYRITVDRYRCLAEAGVLTARDRVVLLDGLLVKTMTKGTRHVVATMLVWSALEGLRLGGWHVKKEDPISLPGGPGGYDSVPEPDVSVVRGEVRDYTARTPGPGDVALVVEVADSSLSDDRAGLVRYAWAKIPFAWIVNLTNETVEVYARPTGPADPARYLEKAVYGPGDHVPVVVGGGEAGRLAVRDLLP